MISEKAVALLPCPFCGKAPEIGPFASAITIHCANDDCDVGIETAAVTEAAAIEQWNKRAALSLHDDHHPLVMFARWAIDEGPFSGCDLDGMSIQDKAEALGLIVRTKYDPTIHGDNDCDPRPGDDWFVFSPLIAEKPSPERD